MRRTQTGIYFEEYTMVIARELIRIKDSLNVISKTLVELEKNYGSKEEVKDV